MKYHLLIYFITCIWLPYLTNVSFAKMTYLSFDINLLGSTWHLFENQGVKETIFSSICDGCQKWLLEVIGKNVDFEASLSEFEEYKLLW